MLVMMKNRLSAISRMRDGATTVEAFCNIYDSQTGAALKLLASHRNSLLENLHTRQK